MILASDNFDRADAATLGANWTAVAGTVGIVSNEAAGKTFDVNGNSLMRYSAITWPNDQYSQVRLRTLIASGAAGPAVRIANATLDCYVAYANSPTPTFAKWVAGVFTSLGTFTAPSVNDYVTLEAISSTLTVYVNGTLALRVTDTSLPTGSAGLHCGNATDQRADDWIGGGIDSIGSANISSSMGRYIGWIR